MFSSNSFQEELFRRYPDDPVKRREAWSKNWIYYDRQMRDLVKSYPDDVSFAAEYLLVLTKKSKLSSHKRDLIMSFFSMVVKQSAIDIITDREKEKPCAES